MTYVGGLSMIVCDREEGGGSDVVLEARPWPRGASKPIFVILALASGPMALALALAMAPVALALASKV